MRMTETTLSRRGALAIGAAGAAALAALPHGVRAQHPSVIQSGGGIAGGGAISLTIGTRVVFSVFGSRFVTDEGDAPVILGNLLVTSSDGQQLASVEITDYAPIGGEENARQMTGFASVDGKGRLPFSLKLIDGGTPGAGKDHVQLTVKSDSADATPSADASAWDIDAVLEDGDLQLIDFNFSA
jgi:hypothetical protein